MIDNEQLADEFTKPIELRGIVRNVFDSSGLELQFDTPESYAKYMDEIEMVNMRYYGMTRNRHGIWASHQGLYVKTVDELGPYDSRYMESRYQAALKRMTA